MSQTHSKKNVAELAHNRYKHPSLRCPGVVVQLHAAVGQLHTELQSYQCCGPAWAVGCLHWCRLGTALLRQQIAEWTDATEQQRDAMAQLDLPVMLRPPAKPLLYHFLFHFPNPPKADRDNRPNNPRGPGITVDNCGFHKPVCVWMLVVNETLGYWDKCMSMDGNIDEWCWAGGWQGGR